MVEFLRACAGVYIFTSMAAVGVLVLCSMETNNKRHWTVPFAGALWPILAIIGVYMVWVKRND